MSTTYSYNVTGMTCGSCVAYLESTISKLPEIDSVSVSLMLNKAEIKTKPGRETELLDAIKQTGFSPTLLQVEGPGASTNPSNQRKPLGLKRNTQQQKQPLPMAFPFPEDDSNNNLDEFGGAEDDHFESAPAPVTSSQQDNSPRSSPLTTTPQSLQPLQIESADLDVKGLLDEFDALLSSVQSTPTKLPQLTPTRKSKLVSSQPASLQHLDVDAELNLIAAGNSGNMNHLSPLPPPKATASPRKIAALLDEFDGAGDFDEGFGGLLDQDDLFGFGSQSTLVGTDSSHSDNSEKSRNSQHSQSIQNVSTTDNSASLPDDDFAFEFEGADDLATQSLPLEPVVNTEQKDTAVPSKPKGSCCGGKSKVAPVPEVESEMVENGQNDQNEHNVQQEDSIPVPPEPKKGGCCGGKGKVTPTEPVVIVQNDHNDPNTLQTALQEDQVQIPVEPKKGGCCGGKNKVVAPELVPTAALAASEPEVVLIIQNESQDGQNDPIDSTFSTPAQAQAPIEPVEPKKGGCCGGKGKALVLPVVEPEITKDQKSDQNDQKVDSSDTILPSEPKKGGCCGGKGKAKAVDGPQSDQTLAQNAQSLGQNDLKIDLAFDRQDSGHDSLQAGDFLDLSSFLPNSTPPSPAALLAGAEKPEKADPIVPESDQRVENLNNLDNSNSVAKKPAGGCCGGKSKAVPAASVLASAPDLDPTTKNDNNNNTNNNTNNDLLGDFGALGENEGSFGSPEAFSDDFLTLLNSPSSPPLSLNASRSESQQLQSSTLQVTASGTEVVAEKPKGSCCGGKKNAQAITLTSTSTSTSTSTAPSSSLSNNPDAQSILDDIGSEHLQKQQSAQNEGSDDDFAFEFTDPQAKLEQLALFDPLQGFTSLNTVVPQGSPELTTNANISTQNGQNDQQAQAQPKKGGCCGGKGLKPADKVPDQVSEPEPILVVQNAQEKTDDFDFDPNPAPAPVPQPKPVSSCCSAKKAQPTPATVTAQQDVESKTFVTNSQGPQTHIFGVTGMTCGSCVAYLESKINQLPTVESVSVSLMLNRAEIKGGDQNELFDVIKSAGFTPTHISSGSGATGKATKPAPMALSKPQQTNNNNKSNNSHTDVAPAVVPPVSRSQQRALQQQQQQQQQEQEQQQQQHKQLSAETTTSSTSPVSSHISNANGTPSSPKAKKIRSETPSEKLAKQAYEWFLRLQVALTFAVPIFIIAMILPLNETANDILMTPLVNSATVMGLVLFILATPVQFGVGRIFITNAIQALKNGHSNMSVLIAIGSLSAYLYSFVSLASNFFTFNDSPYAHAGMREHFFETSSTLITVVIFGQYLEHVAKGHTSSALSKLMSLQPSTATTVSITAAGLAKTQGLSLRNNQVDDDLFAQVQSFIPSFSFHYNSSAFSLDSNPGASASSKDAVPVVVGGSTTFLTPAQKYKFDHLLLDNGLSIDMFDDTQDINKYITTNSQKSIDTEDLQEGIYVKIIRGSKIPADCMLVCGTIYIDDSVVTGESIQRKKIPGSTLIAGTVVTEGVCIAMVLRAGEDTTLSQIVTLVEQAQISKAPISAFADQISLYFVPTIIALSIITLLVWWFVGSVFNVLYWQINPDTGKKEALSILTHAVLRSVAVVVIACPCALGLATPTAVMVATGVGAKHGVLIKGGAALEAAANIDTVVFDKTGTITRGQPQVVCSMVFSPAAMGTYVDTNKTDQKTANGQHLLKLMSDHMPDHLFLVNETVNAKHYSTVVQQAIAGQADVSSSPQQKRFGKTTLFCEGSTHSTAQLFSQTPSSPVSMSFQLNQLLRVMFTLVSLAESNTEHFLGTCLAKYAKSHVLSYGQDLLSKQDHATSQQQFQHLLELNEGYFSMSHVVNQTGRGVKCDIAVPLSLLPTTASGSQPNKNGITMAPVIVGNANWLIENDIYIPPTIASIAIQLESQGLTVIFSAIQQTLVGLFSIGDEIKPEAFEVVDYLQRVMKYDIFVLTGDNVRNAKFLANRLKIPQSQVYAHLSPAQKLNIIQQLQIHGRVVSATTPLPIPPNAQAKQQEHLREKHKFKVADVFQYIPIVGSILRFITDAPDKTGVGDMGNENETQNGQNGQNGHGPTTEQKSKPRSVLFVGDGINDSPALAQAQVGIAIGAGTDVAIESADMVLVRNDLADLLTAIVLSKHTLHRIKSNFGWSLLYNVLSIPLAAGALFPFTSMILPPEVAALAMGCSSVSVILSSLWLKLFKSPLQSKLSTNTNADGSDGSGAPSRHAAEVGFDRKPNKKGFIQTDTAETNNKNDHHTIDFASSTSTNNGSNAGKSTSIFTTLGKKGQGYKQFNDQE